MRQINLTQVYSHACLQVKGNLSNLHLSILKDLFLTGYFALLCLERVICCSFKKETICCLLSVINIQRHGVLKNAQYVTIIITGHNL